MLVSKSVLNSEHFPKAGLRSIWPNSEFFDIKMIFSVLAVYQNFIFGCETCIKALIHGRDRNLLHIQDVAGKKIRYRKKSWQGWKYRSQPGKNTIRHPLRPLCRSKNGVSISLSQFQKILKVFEVYLLDNMSFELITSGKSFVTLVTCKSFCRVKGTDVLTYQGILGKFLKKNREKI